MHKLSILVKQSLKNKMFKKSFVLYTILVYAIIVFISCLPMILINFNKSSDIEVEIYSTNDVVAEAYHQLLSSSGDVFTSSYVFTVDDVLPSEIEGSSYEAIINLDDMTIYTLESSTISDTDMLIFNSLYQTILQQQLALEYQVDPNYIKDLNTMPTFTSEAVLVEENAPANDKAYALHVIIMIPLFILIMVVTQIVSMEISEEKTSRAMEIMLSSITSKTHMISKVISATVFLIVQVFTMGLGVITGLAINIYFLGNKEGAVDGNVSEIVEQVKAIIFSTEFLTYFIFVVVMLIITVITYVILIATFTSTVNSIEDVSKIQTPVMLIMVAGFYYMIFATQFANLEQLSMVLGLLPLFNIMLAPLLYITGVVSVTYLLVSTIIALIFMVIIFLIVQKPYKFGLLNYSSESSFKVLKKAFFSNKV